MKSTIQYIKKKKPWADFSVPALVASLRETLAATPRAARCRTTCARTDKGRFIHPHNRRRARRARAAPTKSIKRRLFSPQPLQLRHLPPVKVRDTWHRHEASTSDGVVGAPLIRQEEVFAMCYSGFYLFILSGSEGRWRRFKVKPGRGFQKEKSEEV